MKYYYDLHIHSVLSPDSDVLMTPNNILNMAQIKKLDIIAITDHNSLKQLPVIHEIAQSYDFLFVPGVEVHVKEDFHVLCYFKTIDDAMAFDRILEDLQKKQKDIISPDEGQWVTDDEDIPMIQYPYRLLKPLDLTLEALITILKPYDHMMVYAHIDRQKYSGFSYLHKVHLDAVEISRQAKNEWVMKQALEHYVIFHSSDAHQLTDIAERGNLNVIELEELSIDALFKRVKHG